MEVWSGYAIECRPDYGGNTDSIPGTESAAASSRPPPWTAQRLNTRARPGAVPAGEVFCPSSKLVRASANPKERSCGFESRRAGPNNEQEEVADMTRLEAFLISLAFAWVVMWFVYDVLPYWSKYRVEK